jgi:hypothetical protein
MLNSTTFIQASEHAGKLAFPAEIIEYLGAQPNSG